jgi:hypothetical protein
MCAALVTLSFAHRNGKSAREIGVAASCEVNRGGLRYTGQVPVMRIKIGQLSAGSCLLGLEKHVVRYRESTRQHGAR